MTRMQVAPLVLATIVSLMTHSTAATASMAPEYRRLNEFYDVLQAYQSGGVMRLGVIEGIERTGADTYRIWSHGCQIEATLHWPPPAPGPPMAGGDPDPIVAFGEPLCER